MTSTLVTGGVRSGKSRHAESLLPDGSAVLYLAPGPPPTPGDREWADRVAAHRARRPASWRTLETVEVATAIGTATQPVILDCLGTWLTRLVDEAGGWEQPGRAHAVATAAQQELTSAVRHARHDVVLVTNEVGAGVVPDHPSGRLFRDELGRMNAALGEVVDRLHLVVAGRVLDLTAAPRAGDGPR